MAALRARAQRQQAEGVLQHVLYLPMYSRALLLVALLLMMLLQGERVGDLVAAP
jgi:hypothetical protein